MQRDDGMLVAPTGFGKTVVAANLIASKGVTILVLIPRETMINAYAGRERPRGWSFLAHHWELIIVSLEQLSLRLSYPAATLALQLVSV